MNFLMASVVAIGFALISTFSSASDSPSAGITSAAPDVKVMTQTPNPKITQQNKKTGVQKAQRPASPTVSKPLP
jgi:hypothetical protein